MQLEDSFDADSILRDPFDDEIDGYRMRPEEEVEELTLGDPNRIADLDIEEDDYGL
jgi:hypothetical protein